MRSCSFFQGTVILTVSSLLIKFLGFFYKIFLAQAMGAEGMGIYQLIFPVFAVCHSLTSSGLEVAISRFTARSRGHEQSDYLWAGLFLTLTSSLVIGLFLWTRSDFIALTLLHETRCAPLLKFLAATIPLAGFHGCFCGFCLGRKNASLPAFSQLTEQAVRIGSVWLLYHIFLQEGMEITPMLAAAGLLTGEIASVLFILTFAANKTLLPSSLSACFHRCPDIAHHVHSCHRQPCQSDFTSKCGSSPDSSVAPAIRSFFHRSSKSVRHSHRYVPVFSALSQCSHFFSVCHAAPCHIGRAGKRKYAENLPGHRIYSALRHEYWYSLHGYFSAV